MAKMSKRCSAWLGAVAAGLGLAFGAAHAQDTDLKILPPHVGAQLYFGQLFNVADSLQERLNFNGDVVTLPQTSLWMIQEAVWREHFKFNLGIAGTFWYPFPEDNTKPWYSYRTGGVAIAQANGTYSAGDIEKPWLQITVGQQGYKYNPQVRNFGEYLFRSEPYPTTVRTGDWGPIDNAGAGIWGIAFKTNWKDGLIKNDFLVSLANERVPLHDVSLTNITSLNFGKVFSIGGGVMLSRLIQIDPDKSSPKDSKTGYFTWSAQDQANLRTYLTEKIAADPNFLSNNPDFMRTISEGNNVVDTVLEIGKSYWAASKRPLVSFLTSVPSLSDPRTVALGVNKYSSIEYVDARAIQLMGRASFDPKSLFGLEDMLGSNDLTLYGEVAVLGWKNYPIFYTERSQRIPMMIGFYIPTFGLLDFLTVEAEQWKNPHVNSDYIQASFRQPQPKGPSQTAEEIPSIADPYHDIAKAENPKAANVNYTEDDFKWTVTGLKSFGVMNVAAQVGKDHFRPLTGEFRPSLTEALAKKSSWYYMLRLMVNF